MPLVTARDFKLTPDTSQLTQLLTQAIMQSAQQDRQDERLQQTQQAEQVKTDLATTSAQLLRVRDIKDNATQRKEIAKLGQEMIKQGKDPSIYNEALNITNPDEMNLYLTRSALKGDYAKKFIDQRLKSMNPAAPGTANIQDYEYYQQLEKTDPEGAKKFGQDVGLVSREGRELSAYNQKALDEATTTAIKSGGNVGKFTTLANELDAANIQGGKGTRVSEYMKNITGNQDEITNLRRGFFAIRSSQAVNNLPPGVASDKDIELALKGFPGDDASGDYMASFLRGMAKMEKFNEQFNTYKADFIAQHGSMRTSKGKNMLSGWKENIKNNPVDISIDYSVPGKAAPQPGQQPITGQQTITLPNGVVVRKVQ